MSDSNAKPGAVSQALDDFSKKFESYSNEELYDYDLS